jgi:uncharacterized protein YcfJ
MKQQKEVTMKKLATAVAGLIMLSSTAMANSFSISGTVIASEPVHTTIARNNPTQVCNMVDVPIYGNSNTNFTGEQVLGAIIGGVIGSKIGKGDGRDIAIGTGAVIGSQIGKNQNQKIVGYKQVQQCHTNNEIVNETVLSHYNTTVEAMGQTLNTQTSRQLTVGDTVTVDVHMSVR